jgi:hypothetical protein
MASELPEECCAKCRFRMRFEDTPEWGGSVKECRRNAPVAVVQPWGGVQANFPTMVASDWCGEFQPRKAEPTSPA